MQDSFFPFGPREKESNELKFVFVTVNDEETLELQCDKSDKKIKRSQICDFIQDCDLNDDEALCGE